MGKKHAQQQLTFRRAATNTASRAVEDDAIDADATEGPSTNLAETLAPRAKKKTRTATKKPESTEAQAPLLMVTKPLPRVLLLHTGGTLGMDPTASYDLKEGDYNLKEGTGGSYKAALQPGQLLADLFTHIPELRVYANIDVKVCFNRDSCRVGPKDWVKLGKMLDRNRENYDAFVIVHGTDTMAYTASALSLMLSGFAKPIIVTGSQLPLLMPRSDARQNLLDSLTCATASFNPPHVHLEEVAICFGGKLLRGNRAQKTNASTYQAFSSPAYPDLAELGVDVDWNHQAMIQYGGIYRPRFELDPRVIRIPIVPGSDPRLAYGDLYERGVRGVVLEAFGLGNMPDLPRYGWIPWLKKQRKQGLLVYLSSQCVNGSLRPDLYQSGQTALDIGVETGGQMTPECAVVKMMLCLAHPNIPIGQPLAGEL
ncbi:hypothetical protein CYMTET_54719 [Cymbomonas tetramitiformis]|uniref:asparaginase n=1 Tax=Cymbomonas tetramitiformis TaxID=36881 RepID=A0AAE0BEB9_9CHLO|nr:hypothetical protein CYMTET_54719 [Cymbomonas tetramitiformis]